MRWLQLILLLLIIILGISFASLNHGLVNINYYFNQATLPLAVLLALTFSLGCVMGAGIGLFWLFKQKLKYLNLKMQIHSLEKKLKQLSSNEKENSL